MPISGPSGSLTAAISSAARTRRGATTHAAKKANADTFHFTNCCPQEFRFNERALLGRHRGLRPRQHPAERPACTVFTGPVFAATDPTYRTVRVPLQFFKVIARVDQR